MWLRQAFKRRKQVSFVELATKILLSLLIVKECVASKKKKKRTFIIPHQLLLLLVASSFPSSLSSAAIRDLSEPRAEGKSHVTVWIGESTVCSWQPG